MRNHGWLGFSLSFLLSCALLLGVGGCTNGYRVVRSAANVEVLPGSIAVVHEETSDAHTSDFARGFSDELARALPAYQVVPTGPARYRLHVQDVAVRPNDTEMHGEARLALLDEDGDLIDLVQVSAVEPDATQAGAAAARHFARFLGERRHEW